MNFNGNERGGGDPNARRELRQEKRGRDREDDGIRACFEVLRTQDEREAPFFERVWDAARLRAGRARRRRNRRLAAAAVVVFLAVGSALFLGRRGPLFRSSVGGSITEWTSPTAALLVYAGAGLSTADAGGEAVSAAGTTRFVSGWSSPTASLLRPPGGEGDPVGRGGETAID